MPKLLIVDDEIDLCDLIAELADDAGLTVMTVSDGSAVEAAVTDFAPDAMLLDLMMPGTDGVELLTRLADKLKGVTMALMSGSDARVLNSARRLGSARGLNIIATLEKPLEIALIRDTLAALTSQMGGNGAAAPVTAAGLSQAIAERRVQIVVQPILAIADKRQLGVEILPRWPQADGSVLTADQFIDKARADGVLGQLTQEIVETALAGLSRLPESATIAFNISPEQLGDPYFESRLIEAAQRHKVAVSRLALELSETPLENAADMQKALASLRGKGVQIWLTDYAGAMNVGKLMQLPLSGIKLGRALVHALPDPAAQATITGAVALAAVRQLPVYAVAVETEGQLQALQAAGVVGAQGNLLGAPQALDTFLV